MVYRSRFNMNQMSLSVLSNSLCVADVLRLSQKVIISTRVGWGLVPRQKCGDATGRDKPCRYVKLAKMFYHYDVSQGPALNNVESGTLRLISLLLTT